eukprot:17573-Heterococcus_DN1.PRE.5
MAGTAPGSLLISGSADKTVMVWDTRATARGAMHCLNGHQDRVTRYMRRGVLLEWLLCIWWCLCCNVSAVPTTAQLCDAELVCNG